VDFSLQLPELELPVTIFAGKNKASAIPSDISDATLQLYVQALSSSRIVDFLQSGHMIPDEEPEKYIAEVKLYISARMKPVQPLVDSMLT